jgi:2,3-bisphosphoglycerate-dependent phosphoglycerate mutase
MSFMKKNLNLFVLTHCESRCNEEGTFSGRIDSELTTKGHERAKFLADKLKDEKIGRAYSSPLTRSKQTLEHILKYHPETERYVDERIIERDYGRLSGKSKAKYAREHPNLYPIYHRSYDTPPPGGESMKQVEKRVLAFVRDLVKLMREKKMNALIVAHSNSIRPIRRYFEGLTPKEMMKLENYRCKIFKYRIAVNN